MKRFFVLILSVVLIATLAACSTDNASGTGEAQASASDDGAGVASTASGSKKVAGVVFMEDQFMKQLQMGYRAAAEEAGYEFYPGNTNGDASKEVEMLNTYITQGYAGVAIAPTSSTASIEPLKNAAESNLIVGISNSNLDDTDWMAGCYTSDDYQLGQMTGEACAAFIEEHLDGTARIGLLNFRPVNAEMAADRSNGFIDAVTKLEGVEIVAHEDAWEQDKAITVATDMLTAHPEINIIWGANEGGTVGGAMAIKNQGRVGEVFAFGTDASEQTAALLLEDEDVLQAVTGQDPYQIGVETMQAVIRAAEGVEDPNHGKRVVVPGFLLSRSEPEEIDVFLEDLKAIMG